MLPENFVWTRYGTESGESMGSILARKERERLATGGRFLWGIGNSVGPSVRRLLDVHRGIDPFVVFSPMLAAPKQADVTPGRVSVWTSAVGIDGRDWEIPEGVWVTSRASAGAREKLRHYALVCQVERPLVPQEGGPRFSITDLRNFASGNPVGASQVTSVVSRQGCSGGGSYIASLIAQLVYPFVVELGDPRPADAPQVPRRGTRQLTFEAGLAP